jgi:hypothetical protein
MYLDPYLANILIRSQIAEMHRQAAQRQLVRQATSSTSRPQRQPLIPTLARAFSIAWLKRDTEREVLS